MRRIAAVLVVAVMLVGCSGTESDEGELSGPAESDVSAGRGPTEDLAVIAFGPGFDDGNVTEARRFIASTIARCDDLADATAVADLYAGVYTAIDERAGGADGPEILRGLDAAFDASTTGMSCSDIATGYAATVIG